MTVENENIMSKKQLLKSTVYALIIGLFVFVVAVLPAAYGKDPLGTGKLFGFDKLYTKTTQPLIVQKQLKIEKLGSNSNVPKPIEAFNPIPDKQYNKQIDTIKIVIPAKKGIEYKFNAKKLAAIKYEWFTTNKAVVYLDFHGEVKQANPPKNVFYESYTLAYSNNMAGTFTAPFNGKHGWYFRNDYDQDIQLFIILNGEYKLLD
ncbi:MAG: hypothetical protein V3U80_01425 [Flavobacteriaceae bacterium]